MQEAIYILITEAIPTGIPQEYIRKPPSKRESVAGRGVCEIRFMYTYSEDNLQLCRVFILYSEYEILRVDFEKSIRR